MPLRLREGEREKESGERRMRDALREGVGEEEHQHRRKKAAT